MNWDRFLLTAFSAIPLLLAGWIWNLSIDLGIPNTPQPESQEVLPDSLTTNLRYLQFSSAGEPTQRLSSSRAQGYGEGSEIYLDEPSLLVVGDEETRWSASSNRGYLDRPGSKLDLLGNVVLNRLGTSSVRLQTNSLTWLPTAASAYTNDHVVFETPGSFIESDGISIELDESTFILHSNVRGSHESP